MGYLTFERIWSDTEFFEVSITFKNEIICVVANTYVNDEVIHKLSNRIIEYLSLRQDTFSWELGKKGMAGAYIQFTFLPIDKFGHSVLRCDIDFNNDNENVTKVQGLAITSEISSLDKFASAIPSICFGNEGIKVSLE